MKGAGMISDCAEMELLLNADLDGELDAAQSAALARHVAGCRHCMQQRVDLLPLQNS